jgi:hypothetical protein
MLDHNGVRAPLDRVEVTEARKSLGLMIAGDCNWKAEHARLLRASRLWKANLQAGHLSESDAWYALNHTINRTVKYPMMATYLDKSQCEDIMKPFLNAGLSASGVTSKMPRPMLCPPPPSGPFKNMLSPLTLALFSHRCALVLLVQLVTALSKTSLEHRPSQSSMRTTAVYLV